MRAVYELKNSFLALLLPSYQINSFLCLLSPSGLAEGKVALVCSLYKTSYAALARSAVGASGKGRGEGERKRERKKERKRERS